MTEQVLTNARIVLDDRVIKGSVVVANGRITDISETPSSVSTAIDLEGDLLIPGLVELHTDSLEGHMTPRPKTDWPATAALIAHDSQIAISGITTVFDAIAVGALSEASTRVTRLKEMISAIDLSVKNRHLRADHLIHLRCETSYPELQTLFDSLVAHPLVRLISVMDHTPGQRQFVSEEKYRTYYQGKFGLSDPEMDEFIIKRKADQKAHGYKNRQHVIKVARARNLSLASHDDATAAHVDEAKMDGMTIAEFPTTMEAAKESHEKGLNVMMGAPNLVRGGSHSGNASARDFAKEGVLDIVSSDYIPNSLLHAAFLLFEQIEGYDLSRAIRTVSKAPAQSAGLHDRGEIKIGYRADLVHVHHTPHHPLIRGVWREGYRIA